MECGSSLGNWAPARGDAPIDVEVFKEAKALESPKSMEEA